jgi:EpsI family protein
MTPMSPKSQFRMSWAAASVCAAVGGVVFQFFGNSNHGYIDTASLFYWWGYQWVNPDSETQHGWLILGLSAWLLWRNLRTADHGSPAAEATPGSAIHNLQLAAAAMMGGLLLHALGFAVQQARISILAFLFFGWGVLSLGGGTRWRRAAAFPLAFLVFAIPLSVLDSVGFWLRLWVIKASSGIAHAAGIGVLQSGTQLLAPDGRYQYDVAAACSGVRSLMALAALSLLAGYLNFRQWGLRAVIFLLCFPLVYLGNVARITSIIFAAQRAGQAGGERVHDVMGYGIFLIVLGGVLWAVGILRRLTEGRDERSARPADKATTPATETDGRAAHPYRVASVIVILAVGEMFFLAHLSALPPRGAAGVQLAVDGLNPVELPTFLGTEWIGRRVEVSAVEREILPPDTGFSRKLYVPVDDPARAIFLSIVLSGRDRTSIHRPEICLVGQGWTLEDATTQRFNYPGHEGAPFSTTVLHVQREIVTRRGRETVPQLVVYWFVSSDAVVATHGQRFIHDAWNRLRHLRADRWAYVLMQTDARAGDAAALARMQALLDQVLPVFQPPLGTR